MDLNQIFTPEIKTALSTLAGVAGVESFFGAMNNKYVKHQSFVILTGSKVCKALGVVFSGIGAGLDRVQDFGGKIETKVSEVNDNASG
jgi:hypothetical protein